ncbi:MAG: AMP-binding protein [Hyphomicrobiales bacterium]|nr:AMP-binding protein [Hyphomicrobiales bacterium]
MLEGCVPWPEELAASYRQKGYWEDITLGQMLDARIAETPDAEVLVSGDERLTYAGLGRRIDRLAYRLHEAGLKPLDRVVLQLGNGIDFVLAFFALVRIGVIPVMALPPHRRTEIRHFVARSGAVGYVVPDRVKDFDYRDMADEVRKEYPRLGHVFVSGEAGPGQTSLADLLAAPADAEAVRTTLARLSPDPAEVALMLLSGGTTALPKLIPRTHNDYVCNCKLSGRLAGFSPKTVFLAVLPMGHNFTLASPGILAIFAYGGKVVVAPGPRAADVFPVIERERVTATATAVPLVATWLEAPERGQYDLSSLRLIQSGGARLPPELRRRVRARFGCVYQEVYGTAEGLLNMTRLNDPDEIIEQSSGAPVCEDDEIKVVDDAGNEVPDGTPGELVTRGPYTIRGYYDNPEANDKGFTDDGFYRMGDVVRKIGRYVYTEGRKKDLVNRGGEKISCDEVEDHILAHPKVRNVCVVAMPDEIFGEKACAYAILAEGETLSLKELCDFLLKREIAKFKLPERLEIVDAFPISPAGKILRRDLRERIEAKIAEERGAASAARS